MKAITSSHFLSKFRIHSPISSKTLFRNWRKITTIKRTNRIECWESIKLKYLLLGRCFRMYVLPILIKDNRELDNLIIINLFKKYIIIGILLIKWVFLIFKHLFNNGLKIGKFDWFFLIYNYLIDINKVRCFTQ
jgi:hypothetical protein